MDKRCVFWNNTLISGKQQLCQAMVFVNLQESSGEHSGIRCQCFSTGHAVVFFFDFPYSKTSIGVDSSLFVRRDSISIWAQVVNMLWLYMLNRFQVISAPGVCCCRCYLQDGGVVMEDATVPVFSRNYARRCL